MLDQKKFNSLISKIISQFKIDEKTESEQSEDSDQKE